MKRILLAWGILAGLGTTALAADGKADLPAAPSNGGFEDCKHVFHMPSGWSATGKGYESYCYAAQSLDGDWSSELSSERRHGDFGAMVQCFDAANYKGKATLTGYLKTSDVDENGYAGLWMRVDDADGNTLAFDNMHDRGVNGFSDWHNYKIELPVDEKAAVICYGYLLVGDGTVWADSLKIETAKQAK